MLGKIHSLPFNARMDGDTMSVAHNTFNKSFFIRVGFRLINRLVARITGIEPVL